MHRRGFLTASIATSAVALSRTGEAQSQPAATREFYQIRRYSLQSGPQTKLTEDYFEHALIPALARMGMGPVGAFQLEYGPETPTYFLLIPGHSVEALATIDQQLSKDTSFLQAAASFWGAPASSPSFGRVESSLLAAFDGWPKLVPPASSATKSKRIFQLRTYESPSNAAHVRKVEMFHSGEFGIFAKAGCNPVFFADTLIGTRTPSLTYMLSFADMQALQTGWDAFSADPDWKKLLASPRYNYEAIVSNVSNLVLHPLAASQL